MAFRRRRATVARKCCRLPVYQAIAEEVKALYDPDDLFKGNHHIPPADAALARVAA